MKNCSLGGKKGSKDDDKAKVEKDTFYVDNFVQSPEKEVLLNRTTNMIKLLEKKLKKVYWGPDRSTNLDDVIVVFASTIIIFAYLKAVFGLDCTFFIRFFWELSVEGIDFTKLEVILKLFSEISKCRMANLFEILDLFQLRLAGTLFIYNTTANC